MKRRTFEIAMVEVIAVLNVLKTLSDGEYLPADDLLCWIFEETVHLPSM